MSEYLFIRPAHLALALHYGDAMLTRKIATGLVPKPDARGPGGLKLWYPETIRRWNPVIADAIADLFKHPVFAPRPIKPIENAWLKPAA